MTNFTCAVENVLRSACEDLPLYGEHEGKQYCVLHYPGEDKSENFTKVLVSKLNKGNYDFRGTVFPEGTSDFAGQDFDAYTNFNEAIFVGNANFRRAQFSGKRTYFRRAQFKGEWADFRDAQFSANRTIFSEAKFNGELTDFSEAKFSGKRTDFARARFGSADTSFEDVTLTKEVDFSEAIFREKVAFKGTVANRVFDSEAWVRFNGCRIEKPEQFTFNAVLLRPGWFIGMDMREVDFTAVHWYGISGWPSGGLAEEIDALARRGYLSPHRQLAEACRRLSTHAEENHEYPLANEFHYWFLEALRKRGRRSFRPILTFYWVLSGYGVRPARAFWALVAIWLTFTALYCFSVESSPFWVFSASDIWQGFDYARQAAVYSLSAMVRLNPRPQSEHLDWFQSLVTIEGILGPLQIALLTLAVRRIFKGLMLPTS